jgi:predicted AlkP superfamily pyrophosphatase or phosphodiesterase
MERSRDRDSQRDSQDNTLLEEDEENNEWEIETDEKHKKTCGERICRKKRHRHLFVGIGGGLIVAIILMVLLIITIPSIIHNNPQLTTSRDILILVSFDGFKYEYLSSKYKHPNFDILMSQSVTAPIKPVFPTKTFPNHYSLITGLYPIHHGIVDNSFYAPELNQTFYYRNYTTQNPAFWLGEPFWNTVKKANMKSATLFWPGSEIAINGQQPDMWMAFDGAMTASERIERAMQWLDTDDKPQFVTLYFDGIDTAGHIYGPESPDMESAITNYADNALGRLMDAIKVRTTALTQFKLVIVSDHGMAQMSESRVIFIEDYVNLTHVNVLRWSPVVQMWPKDMNMVDSVMTDLSNLSNARAYRKEDLPAEWNYSNSSRVAPIVVVADLGWTITTRAYFRANWFKLNGGDHGFDPKYSEMNGIFIGRGEPFLSNVTHSQIQSVDVYNILAHLLNVTSYAAPNDGSFYWDMFTNKTQS